jgi:hypothetical protein
VTIPTEGYGVIWVFVPEQYPATGTGWPGRSDAAGASAGTWRGNTAKTWSLSRISLHRGTEKPARRDDQSGGLG